MLNISAESLPCLSLSSNLPEKTSKPSVAVAKKNGSYAQRRAFGKELVSSVFCLQSVNWKCIQACWRLQTWPKKERQRDKGKGASLRFSTCQFYPPGNNHISHLQKCLGRGYGSYQHLPCNISRLPSQHLLMSALASQLNSSVHWICMNLDRKTSGACLESQACKVFKKKTSPKSYDQISTFNFLNSHFFKKKKSTRDFLRCQAQGEFQAMAQGPLWALRALRNALAFPPTMEHEG